MYCEANKLLELPYCGLHPKPNGARGLSSHYHLRFDPKIGHGICEIRLIPCACVACTSITDKPWIFSIQKSKHAINLSLIVLTGQFWDHIAIGISLR